MKLDKKEGSLFEKLVELPQAEEKIQYKVSRPYTLSLVTIEQSRLP